jgi:hypothetical protein
MGEEDLVTVPIEIDEQTDSTIRDTLQEWQHRITEAEENEVQTYSTIRNVLPHWQEGEFSAAHAESDSTQIYVDNDFQGSLTNSSTLTLRAHPIDPDIVFYVGDTVRLKITKDGFFVQGEQVSAGHKIYDAFCQWMAMNTGRPIEKDPIIKSSFAPLLSRYDLLKKPKD